ncbi:hypothetical protein I862_07535 [endosymbiont of Acanthamoeba sp. UWC8]|uniref:site-specific integrase n=1 Tax=endosymbiont of Acanthamoeba sp. UWC8 TaxID=86106 RepID=UPI0004D169B2|nr:site-specific integrase [endosymbiont of Acanthamoeba sp. UWC8]AIF82061.1 hypothetical protein I862_07535 [endosymbiont of Acanthamoeba sp. UWC8]
MTKLTKTVIEQAEVKEKPYFIFDSQVSGFCVRVSSTGKRHYYLQYMANKSVKRLALGQHSIITTEKARDKAITMLAKIKEGRDPQEEKKQNLNQPTIKELSKRFLEDYIALHCKKSTAKIYHHYFDKHIIPLLGNINVFKVTRADIAGFHLSLRKTPYGANRCLAAISTMFNMAELWGLRADGTNPCKHIKKYTEHKRELYLNKDEAKRLGQVLAELKNGKKENISAVYCIELLLYTGCRLGEIQTLKWDYIDYSSSCIRLPDSKTGARIVHIGANVISLLEEIKAHPLLPKDNPYVIWGKKPLTCLNNMRKTWQNIKKKAGLEAELRIHDLRHSFASFAVSQGMSLPMIGKLLGHSQVQTTARYAHLMPEAVIEAAGNVTSHIAAIISQ